MSEGGGGNAAVDGGGGSVNVGCRVFCGFGASSMLEADAPVVAKLRKRLLELFILLLLFIVPTTPLPPPLDGIPPGAAKLKLIEFVVCCVLVCC